MEEQGHHINPSRAEDALVGQCVRGFASLEHELTALVIYLHTTSTDEKAHNNHTLGKLVKGGMGRMSDFLGEHFSLKLCKSNVAAAKTATNLDILLRRSRDIRNWICHGLWSSAGSDEMKCSFWSDQSQQILNDGDPMSAVPQDIYFTHDELRSISQTALAIAAELRKLRCDIETRLGTNLT